MSSLFVVMAVIIYTCIGGPVMVFTEHEGEGGVTGTLSFTFSSMLVDIDITVTTSPKKSPCKLNVAGVPYKELDKKEHNMYLVPDFNGTTMKEQIDKCGNEDVILKDFKEWYYVFRPREPQLVEIHSTQGAWFGEFTNP